MNSVSPFARSLLALAVIAAILLVIPLTASRQVVVLVTEIAAVLSIALMWNLLAGFGGIVFMGFQVFIGIGGYTLFVAANKLGLPPFPLVLLSALVCAIFALAITPILFRLGGAQLAIGSWVVSEVVRLVVYHTNALGAGGGISLTAMRGVDRSIRMLATYSTSAIILVIALLLCVILMRGRFGLALRAMKDSPIAAEALGVPIRRTQTHILLMTAAISGAAGACYYMITLQVSPTAAFSVNWMALILFSVILGGIGTLEGPIVGVIIYFLLRETMGNVGSVYFIVLGILAIGVTLFAPAGAWGLLRNLFKIDLLPIRRKMPREAHLAEGKSMPGVLTL
ncbi:branched-chain amino acid ABC transporter permease [Rhizobium bangladeshense]|uniref:branched-chain amino acid ABC transporter permease n=1 Tax=Rhizobium bangladeshense TaxID=1138189 RepID=UPI001C838103|nr:branched-chain amino acid ABC transporter permease [Rhizobium bangladeshense]MBX4871030.1 branched-chain amino acid ABC transporter permease [Rhizobium bangladeshense]MBX4871330.1 branched-chain amino acid ABC transporter permease [Rhizobium bangladeshense]MBX4887594.1 branched-chain amino acid ABC transporter permease [Rhizobium bangladeshense]